MGEPQRHRIGWRALVALSLALAWLLAPSARAATTFQDNPSHDGYSSAELRLPLPKLWTADLGSHVSYPLIAQGKVFVLVSGPSYRLMALDEATGRVLWSQTVASGDGPNANDPAYDAGRIFVSAVSQESSTEVGHFEAYDAATGRRLWVSNPIGQWWMETPVVAEGGVVYGTASGRGTTVFALRESDGGILWTRDLFSGNQSGPTLSDDKLFVSHPCRQVALKRTSGEMAWYRDNGCSGGGGRTPTFADGQVWVRDDGDNAGYVFDSETGRIVSSFGTDASKDPAPAVGEGVALFLHAGVLRAADEITGKTRWTFSGDGTLASAPLIAGDIAYVGGQSGRVYAVRLSDGREAWHGDLGAPVRGSEQWDNTAIPGLAAAGGILAVPATGRLVAFGRPLSPHSRARRRRFTVTIRVGPTRLGRALRRGLRVRLRCSAPCRLALRASKARGTRRFRKRAPKARASLVVRLPRAARHRRRLRLRLVARATELHGSRKAAASKRVTISR